MVNLSNELSELSHDDLQYVIDGYFLWAYNTMKQRGINIRSWKAWMGARRRANLKPELDKCYLVIKFIIYNFSEYMNHSEVRD